MNVQIKPSGKNKSISYKLLFLIMVFAPLLQISAQSPLSDSLNLLIQDLSGTAQSDSLNSHLFGSISLQKKLSEGDFTYARNLAKKLNYSKGIAEVDYLQGLYYYNTTNFKQAEPLILKSLDKLKEINNYYILVNAKIVLGELLFEKGSLDTAQIILDEALEIAQQRNLEAEIAAINNNKAKIHQSKGDYNSAMEYYLLSIDYYNKNGKYLQLSTLYNNLASINIELSIYDEAEDLLYRAIETAEMANSETSLLNAYINMALVYRNTGDVELAKTYLLKSRQLAKKTGGLIELAKNHTNTGNLFVQLNEYETAKLHFDSALKLSYENGFNYGIFLNKLNLGFAYNYLKQIDSALYYLDEGNAMKEFSSAPLMKLSIQAAYYRTYITAGDYEKAVPILEEMYELNDSLKIAEKDQRVLELQLKYEDAVSEAAILELETELLSRKSEIRYYIIIALVFASIAGMTFTFFTIRRRKNLFKQKQAELELKNTRIELDFKKRELVSNAMVMSGLREKAQKADANLVNLLKDSNEDTKPLISEIRKEIKSIGSKTSWKEFESRFQEVYPEFTNKLLEKHPDLSPNETRLCSLLRLSLSSKEISALTNRSVRTIENTRFLIRKKLNLNSEDNLIHYLLNI